MNSEELLRQLCGGWSGRFAPLSSPMGGGGPGRFRVAGPLQCFMNPTGFENWLPHPSSPAARQQPLPMPPLSAVQNAATNAAAGAAAQAVQKALGPLQVSQGQVTFDAEGNDIPSSPYFSRQITWPGNAESGVTLGRGYDMGNRTEAQVKADLIAAGLDAAKAAEFAKGAGKKGALHAGKFVKDNQKTLGTISQEVQKKLFENIYPKYVTRAKENYDDWTTDDNDVPLPGRVAWDKLDPAIRDVLVDFVYQGFTQGANPMVKGMRDDYDELIKYIQTTPALSQYEPGRKRVDYLKKAKAARQPSTPATTPGASPPFAWPPVLP